MNENVKNRPVILFFMTIILLLASSFIPSGDSILGIYIKQVDILIDLKEDVQEEEIQYQNEEELWDEHDDFFDDDPALEEDTVKQNNYGS